MKTFTYAMLIAASLVCPASGVHAVTTCDCGTFCTTVSGTDCGKCKPATDTATCRNKPRPVAKTGRPKR